MKFSISALALLAVTAVAAATSEREYTSYVVSFEDDTPDSVVKEAMDQVKANDGIITHIYHIIKGFSVDSPTGIEALTFITADDYTHKQYKPKVEQDQVVTTQHTRRKNTRSG